MVHWPDCHIQSSWSFCLVLKCSQHSNFPWCLPHAFPIPTQQIFPPLVPPFSYFFCFVYFTILKLCLLSLWMMLSTCIFSPAILTQLRHSSISLLLTALHPIPSPCFSLTIACGYHAISLDLIVCLSFSIFSLHVIVDNDNIGTITVTYNLRQVVFLDCFLPCCSRQVLYKNLQLTIEYMKLYEKGSELTWCSRG